MLFFLFCSHSIVCVVLRCLVFNFVFTSCDSTVGSVCSWPIYRHLICHWTIVDQPFIMLAQCLTLFCSCLGQNFKCLAIRFIWTLCANCFVQKVSRRCIAVTGIMNDPIFLTRHTLAINHFWLPLTVTCLFTRFGTASELSFRPIVGCSINTDLLFFC